jgi:cardiolipin synthase A/B
MKRVTLVASTAAVSVLITLLAQNFASTQKDVSERPRHEYSVASSQFARALSSLVGPPLIEGNRVTDLQNGDEIFPAMLEAIRGAEKTITFETYIYWHGEIGRQFTDAMAERARAGVRVHVLVDWVGASRMDQELARIAEAGGQVEKYHEPGWRHLERVNNRTHRKLLVIDGKVGFTGGVGIADPWRGSGDRPDVWRDSQYRLEGPAVAEMQAAFMDNWLEARGQVLSGDDYFPALRPAGTMRAQVIRSSSDDGAEGTRLLYLLSIAAASRSVLLENAYFVPDELTVKTLIEAARRGVKVQIIVPALSDTEVVQKASRAVWGELLDGGVEIWQFQPAKFHMKVMIVDDLWVSVGSTNFDNRSFKLNDEANLNVLDADFARAQSKVFEHDLRRSHRITAEEWRKRPLRERIAERAAALFDSQL